MDRNQYPENWEEISHQIRFGRAGGRCEGSPAYPDCRAEHDQPHPVTGSTVVLTTAHLGIDKPDGTPGDKSDTMDCRPENLKAMCQRCHLTFDLADHLVNAAVTRRQKRIEAGQLELPMELPIKEQNDDT